MSHPLVQFFSSVPLFSRLSPDDLNEIIRGVRPFSLATGDTLFKQGDAGDAAYVVQSGEVNVYARADEAREVHVAALGPGAVIGELALLDGAPRSASVRAAEPTQLLRIDRGEFEFLRRNLRPAAFKLIRSITVTLCERLRETNQQITRELTGDTGAGEAAQKPEEDHSAGWLRRLFRGR